MFYDFISGSVILGGQTYDCQALECAFGEGTISALRNITFPSNGQTFTIRIPATVDPILLTVPTPGQGQGFVQAELQIPSGELALTFDFNPSFPNGPPPYYSLDQGTFTSTASAPEPGPLGLMVAGLLGILGLTLKRSLPDRVLGHAASIARFATGAISHFCRDRAEMAAHYDDRFLRAECPQSRSPSGSSRPGAAIKAVHSARTKAVTPAGSCCAGVFCSAVRRVTG